MKEVWFFAACVLTLGALTTNDERIRVVMALEAIVLWAVFFAIWRYGRLVRDTTQQKDV